MERKKNTFALEKESSMAGGRENCVIQQGVVLRIEGERMVVGVAQAEACSACAARAACGKSECRRSGDTRDNGMGGISCYVHYVCGAFRDSASKLDSACGARGW